MITNGLVTSIINRDSSLEIRKAKEQYYINKIEICKGNGR